jgi:hypothetical protein
LPGARNKRFEYLMNLISARPAIENCVEQGK